MASPQAMDMDHMEVKSEQGLSPDAYVKEEAAGAKEEEEDKKMEMKQEMATTEWTEGLIPEATDLDLQKNLVISALKQLLEKFGSARVYLEQRYKERALCLLRATPCTTCLTPRSGQSSHPAPCSSCPPGVFRLQRFAA